MENVEQPKLEESKVEQPKTNGGKIFIAYLLLSVFFAVAGIVFCVLGLINFGSDEKTEEGSITSVELQLDCGGVLVGIVKPDCGESGISII